jgi:acyl carrier protein
MPEDVTATSRQLHEEMLSMVAFAQTIGNMLELDLAALGVAAGTSLVSDWALDSLQMLEMALAIEELSDSLVSEDEAMALDTLADAYSLYSRLWVASNESKLAGGRA